MSELFSGSSKGANARELRANAQELASMYFGSGCVSVRIFGASLGNTAGVFEANFEARVEHEVEHRAYGPDVCKRCKAESWPHRPIPAPTKWSGDE